MAHAQDTKWQSFLIKWQGKLSHSPKKSTWKQSQTNPYLCCLKGKKLQENMLNTK